MSDIFLKYLQNRNGLMDIENRRVVAKGEGEGVGGTGSLGLVEANDSILRGQAMRSCCTARGTGSSVLG